MRGLIPVSVIIWEWDLNLWVWIKSLIGYKKGYIPIKQTAFSFLKLYVLITLHIDGQHFSLCSLKIFGIRKECFKDPAASQSVAIP